MINFGASLKKAREAKGLSLEQIAKDTRISSRFLAAIESEQFYLLPGGIFNRGFVRAYSERVGLDPVQTLAEYEQLIAPPPPPPPPAPPPEPDPEPEPEPVPVATAGEERPELPPRLYSVAIAVLSSLALIFYLVARDSAPTAQSADTPIDSRIEAAPPTSASTPPAVVDKSPPPATANVPVETDTVSPAIKEITIVIEAKERTWINVKADGNPVNRGESLRKGMTRRFAARESIDVAVNNAGGVILKINDLDTKPLGKRGKSRAIHITHNNIKDFLQTRENGGPE